MMSQQTNDKMHQNCTYSLALQIVPKVSMDATALTDAIAQTEVRVDSMVLVSLQRAEPVNQDGRGLHVISEVILRVDTSTVKRHGILINR